MDEQSAGRNDVASVPVVTLFMLMSLDGKISTGSSDERDFDKDLPQIVGVAEGLGQYYRLEQETDSFSLNTGRVLAKVGWNQPQSSIDRLPVSFVVVDTEHLSELGVRNLLARTQRLILVTSNHRHPATHVEHPELDVVTVASPIDFNSVFGRLAQLGVRAITVQSGGTLNASLVRAGLVDYVSVVVAPVLVGGSSTPTLIDGESLNLPDDLRLLQPLQLLDNIRLKNSYLHLRYAVARPNPSSAGPAQS
ncbi:MAG: dihydrofolate reductase family protein [Actinomycetota bacterium]|nr:dihydrofolate reductase family protein [Actinomycetota bacterium]